MAPQSRKNKKKHQQEILRKKRSSKLRFMMATFIIMVFGLTARTFYIKAEFGDQYERKAIEQQVLKNNVDQYITPNRGTILDRNQSVQALAISTTVYDVVWDIRLIAATDMEVQADAVEKINRILDIPVETLWDYLYKDPTTGELRYNTHYQIIYKEADTKTKNMLESENPKYIFCVEGTKRRYPNGALAASLVGFVRGDDANWGLEAKYNNDLTGTEGRMVKMYDQDNNVVTEKVDPTQGNTLITTIDLTIQQIAQEIAETYGKLAEVEHSAMLVLNPKTGEVLAMAEYPSFDPNNPTDITAINDEKQQQQISGMDENERMDFLYDLWTNFSVSYTFEPGSIYKPLVVAAALEEGVISASDTFYCGGGETVLDTFIPCWNTHGHGYLTVSEILSQSCNVGMIKISELMSRETYYQYQKAFGVGEATGIDVIGEVKDYSTLVYGYAGLNPVERAAGSMGQGHNMTAIQAINSFSAVINGGNLMKPYVVSQIVDSNNNIIQEYGPEVQRKVISKETSDWVRTALKNTISLEGTGTKAMIEGYSIGGKTGTAQQGVKGVEGKEEEYTLSFIAFFPVEDPEYIVMSVLNLPEEYKDRDSHTLPMAKDMITGIIQYKHIRPDNAGPDDNTNIDPVYGREVVVLNDYTSLKIAQVTQNLNHLGIDYEINGRGNVVSAQMPSGGSQISTGGKVYLTLEDNGEDELTLIPSVYGMTKEQAEQAFLHAGLIPIFEYRGDPPTDGETTSESEEGAEQSEFIVISQMPQIMLQTGTEIKLYLEIK